MYSHFSSWKRLGVVVSSEKIEPLEGDMTSGVSGTVPFEPFLGAKYDRMPILWDVCGWREMKICQVKGQGVMNEEVRGG